MQTSRLHPSRPRKRLGARRRLLLSLIAFGLIGVSTYVVYAAFSATTANSGNSYAAGTVDLSDNDAGSAMLSFSSGLPGTSDTGCIRITYSGTLDAGLRLYGTVTGSLAPYLTLTVTRGIDSAPSFDSCTNFSADATNYIGAGAGVIYSGLLSAYPSTYAGGIVDPVSGSPETWSQNESHSYKFVVTLNNDPAAAGRSSTASFTWEARNL